LPARDTIVAIATPPGRGGVGIVRVAGDTARVEAIARALAGRVPPARVATLVTLRDGENHVLDAGLALYFPAPHSYTGDATLELHAHGSPAALQLLVARCLELGARLAQPGEFTRRAFLNGKLDLAQAEAVADLIDAASATAARAAARSLTGEFSAAVHAIVAEVTELRVLLEAALDFPDEDVGFVRAADTAARLRAVRAQLAALTDRARAGARLRQGLTVVLAGRPNVGKSSLLNRLVREDAAIVTDVPGTTRDTIERPMELAGVPLTVVDTAGLRPTDDAVERMGIARTDAAVARADVVLVVADARDAGEALHPDDVAVLDRLPAAVPRVIVHNKSDLTRVPAHVERREGVAHVWLSALTGAGVDALEALLLEVAGLSATPDDALMARERHLAALRDADVHVAAALAHLESSTPPLELVAEELREAQLGLAAITGEFTADDLLGAIFARFCIGK
jgi:tRNA modification GTPase